MKTHTSSLLKPFDQSLTPAKPSQLIGAADQPAVWQKMWQQPSNPPPNRRMKDLAIDRHNEGSDRAL